MGIDTKVIENTFSTETGESIETREVSVWPVTADGDIQFETGIYIALEADDDAERGVGITITEETLAALGYVPA